MASPFLFFADDRLSVAELTAACLDGDMVDLGAAYIPADAVETAWLRAGSLARLAGPSLAVTHLSAAWVHDALVFPPTRHTLQRAVPRRTKHLPDPRVVYRDLEVDHRHVTWVAGVRVTTPAKTLTDLVRVPDAEYQRAAALIARGDAAVLAEAITLLEDGVMPYKRSALQTLRDWRSAGQDDVTR